MPVAAATAAFVIVFVAATPYPGVTVDSGEYLAVADGIARGHGFTMPYVSYDEPFTVLDQGERIPMAQFPPLYPAAIAAVMRATRLALLDAARLLNASVFAGVVGLGIVLVRRQEPEWWVPPRRRWGGTCREEST